MTTADLRAFPEDLLRLHGPTDDADLIDQMDLLERAKGAICATQARLAVELVEQRASSSSTFPTSS